MKLNLILSVVFAATASMKESDTSSTSSSTLQAHNAASAAASSEVDLSIADSPLVHAISGGFGSAVSLLMFYPLDRVRVEMQSKVSSPIVSRGRQRKRISKDSLGRDETMTAVLEEECEMNDSEKESMMECFLDLKSKKELYSGVGPVMFSLAVSNFIFFYSHEAVKSMIINQKVKNAVIGVGKALLASTMAGAINVLLTNPLWVATLRIQLAGNENQENIGSRSQVKPGLFAMMTKIVKEEGILKLWSGTLTSLVLCSNPAIQLAFYERCKRNLLNIKRIKNQAISTDMVSLNLVEAFFIGAVAKALATVITYPLQLAQVLLRLQRSQRKTRKKTGIENNLEEECREQYKSTIDCIRKLWNRGGIVELYSGLNAKLLQTILTSAFMFLTYEQTLSIFKKAAIAFMTRKKRSKPF